MVRPDFLISWQPWPVRLSFFSTLDRESALALKADAQPKSRLLHDDPLVRLIAAGVANAIGHDHRLVNSIRRVSAINADTVMVVVMAMMMMMVKMRMVCLSFARQTSAKGESSHRDQTNDDPFHNLGPLKINQPGVL